MKKKTLLTSFLVAVLFPPLAAQSYKDATLSHHERAKHMVSLMTLDEKIAQVGHQTPGITRLGLAGYNYWNEALHGVARSGLATSFPVSKAMSATWDLDLIRQCATVTSDEARIYNNEKGKGLIYWCPTINMSRDPRWGRDEENYGEDPYLQGRIAVEYIKAMQGDDPKYYKTIATAKHFAANNYEGGRHHTSSNMDERNLREYYLPAFEMAVKEGGVRSVMSAYNALNGIPCGANHELLIDILRNEWGFDGFVVSGCGAIDNVYQNHKYVATGAEASAVSMKNGEDLNCGSTFQEYCKEAIQKGLLTEAQLDTALVRVLEARFSVGEFDGASLVPWKNISDTLLDCQAHRQLAHRAAQEAIVLLKNENDFLPLTTDKTVCVIGPMAQTVTLGGYSGSPIDLSTPLEGIAAKMGVSANDGRVEFEDCTELSYTGGGNHLVREANGSSGNLGYIHNGDWVAFNEIDFGEGKTRLTLYTGAQNNNPTVVNISLDTRKTVPDMQISIPPTGSWSSYKETTFNVDPAIFKGKHKVYFTFRFANQSYGANMDWFRFDNPGEENPLQLNGPLYYVQGCNMVDNKATDLETAKKFAAKADVVVLCMGTDLSTSDESNDRESLNLPGDQQKLMEAVYSVNPNVVLVLQTCSSVTINWAQQHVPAIVEAWYGGQAQGHALADVLYGDYNPSGKLTSTWYAALSDLPKNLMQYDIRANNYTYMYYDKEPLYPFGYGLSYTTYKYSNLAVSAESLDAGDSLTVSFDVTNTGNRAGDEIVQLYVHVHSQIERPVKELKGFDRIHLEAGETKRVTIPLRHDQLCYYNTATHTFDVEAGQVDILVGASSADIRLRGAIQAQAATVKQTYKSLAASIGTATVSGSNGKAKIYNLAGQIVGYADDKRALPKGILVKVPPGQKFVNK